MLYLLLFIFATLSADYQGHIAYDVFYRNYSEHLTAPSKSDEQGCFLGLQLGLDYFQQDNLYLGGDVRVATSHVYYDGALQNLKTREITPYTTHSNSVIWNLETRSGYTFGEIGTWRLSPFIGWGLFGWVRGLGEDPALFEEDYYWVYLPIGFKSDFALSPHFNIGFNAKLMPMLYGVMTMSKTWFHLGNRLQSEFELPFTFAVEKEKRSFSLVPYVRFQNIGKSNYRSIYIESLKKFVSFVEPSSSTYIIGLRIEMIY